MLWCLLMPSPDINMDDVRKCFLDLFFSGYLRKQVDAHPKFGSDVETDDGLHVSRGYEKVCIK